MLADPVLEEIKRCLKKNYVDIHKDSAVGKTSSATNGELFDSVISEIEREDEGEDYDDEIMRSTMKSIFIPL